MKNKNGFIASSLMFSFFLVFILLSVLVLTSYAHYNTLLKNLNGEILSELNVLIASKYAGIRNYVRSGANIGSGDWQKSNMTPVKNNVLDLYVYYPVAGQESFFTQTFSLPNEEANGIKRIYVSFKYQKPNTTPCNNSNFALTLIAPDGNRYTSIDNKIYYLDTNKTLKSLGMQEFACGGQKLYNTFGMIIEVPNIVNNGNGYKIDFRASGLNYSYVPKEGSTYVGFNNILVSDVTKLSSGYSTNLVKYLLVDLPYIDSGRKYSLPKM